MQKKRNLWIIVGIIAVVLLIAALIGAWVYLQPKSEPAKPSNSAIPPNLISPALLHPE